MSEIASRVKAIIVDKLGVDENQVTESAVFTTDLGADSLDTVELIMEFEKEFGIKTDKRKITVEDIKQFGTYEFEVKLYTGISAKLFVMVGE